MRNAKMQNQDFQLAIVLMLCIYVLGFLLVSQANSLMLKPEIDLNAVGYLRFIGILLTSLGLLWMTWMGHRLGWWATTRRGLWRSATFVFILVFTVSVMQLLI